MPLGFDATSDSDDNMPDNIPAKAKIDEEDDESSAAEDEYQVEEILGHNFIKGNTIYNIKWLGYEEEEDQTWEPIENLSGAQDLLKKYHRSIGGTPEPPARGKKATKASLGKRKSTASMNESPAPSKKGRKSSDANGNGGASELPIGSWEDHIVKIAAIIETESIQGRTTDPKLLEGLVEWADGRKTQHAMKTLRQKCPQQLLDYYESHLLKPKLEAAIDDD